MPQCLIVDDSKIVRKVCWDMVHDFGFTIAEAGNGKEALEHCQKNTPDVILLDWNMPVMSGIEFLRAFRALSPARNTKIILCTTENELEKIQEALSSGADEYIMKPFDRDILRSKLEQVGLL